MFHGMQSSALLFSPQMSIAAAKLRRLVLPFTEPKEWVSTESHPFQLSAGTDILGTPISGPRSGEYGVQRAGACMRRTRMYL